MKLITAVTLYIPISIALVFAACCATYGSEYCFAAEMAAALVAAPLSWLLVTR